MIYKGNEKIASVYNGREKISSIYKGSDLVYRSSLLPKEYQQVEYLSQAPSYGAYLNTGITPDKDTRVEIDFTFNYSQLGNNAVFGVQVNGFIYQLALFNNRWYYGIATSNESYGDNVNANNGVRHKIIFNDENGGITDNGISYATNKVGTATNPNKEMWLFARNGDGRNSYATVYEFKVYQGNVLIQHLVPCYRKSDNKTGMYDLVTKTFLTSPNGNNFAIGEDVT